MDAVADTNGYPYSRTLEKELITTIGGLRAQYYTRMSQGNISAATKLRQTRETAEIELQAIIRARFVEMARLLPEEMISVVLRVGGEDKMFISRSRKTIADAIEHGHLSNQTDNWIVHRDEYVSGASETVMVLHCSLSEEQNIWCMIRIGGEDYAPLWMPLSIAKIENIKRLEVDIGSFEVLKVSRETCFRPASLGGDLPMMVFHCKPLRSLMKPKVRVVGWEVETEPPVDTSTPVEVALAHFIEYTPGNHKDAYRAFTRAIAVEQARLAATGLAEAPPTAFQPWNLATVLDARRRLADVRDGLQTGKRDLRYALMNVYVHEPFTGRLSRSGRTLFYEDISSVLGAAKALEAEVLKLNDQLIDEKSTVEIQSHVLNRLRNAKKSGLPVASQ